MPLVDTAAAAAAARVKPGTIRQWAHRGTLQAHGTDDARRTVYDLDDVYRAAAAKKRTTKPATTPAATPAPATAAIQAALYRA